MRDQSIETEKRKRIVGGSWELASLPTRQSDGSRRGEHVMVHGRTVPSVSNLEANFPIKRPGQLLRRFDSDGRKDGRKEGRKEGMAHMQCIEFSDWTTNLLVYPLGRSWATQPRLALIFQD